MQLTPRRDQGIAQRAWPRPRRALARGGKAGVDHLGIQVETPDELRGAFSAQDPPQTPAAEPTKETPGEPGKIAHAREETPVESLTGSSQSPPKTAPLPPRRAVDASAERPRAKAAEGKQKGGAPPQETLHTAGGAEATPPSEDIVQRALDSLINGWERAP